MKIITINLPEKYLDAIATQVKNGKVASRSDAVRNALQEFLPKELIFDECLDNHEKVFA